jgi:hypothetical protein
MPIANTTIRLRKSATPGNQPSSLANGEIAINYADGRIYYLNANGSIASISGGGSSSYSFSTINVNSSLVLATSPTDILTLAGANGITVTACTSSKVITIGTTGTVGIDTYARDTANGAASLAQAAFDKANTGGSGSSSGYLANSIIFANASGYLSNTNNLQFFTSNNNFVVTGNVIGGGVRTTSSASAPASPTPGDIWYKTTNDKIYRYTYDGTNSYWIDINTPIFASNGTISIDPWVRDTANAIIGVDLTQNTNITYVTGLAQAAFDKANTGVSTSTDEYARTLANTATNNIVILQGVDTTQNTRISSVDNTANAAYAKANAAFDKANTGGSGSSSGYLANSVIFANATGYLTNTSTLQFFTSNNNFVVTGNVIGGGVRTTTSSTAPDSPTPGDIWYKTTNDKVYRYTYDGTGSYWIDVNTPAFAANGVLIIDSYARDTANLAQANTIYSQGVDTTQNTRITVLEGGLISANSNTVYLNSLISTNNTRISSTDNTATAAYAKANAAFDKANTGVSTSTDDYARATSNTASNNITILQDVNTTQNTRISSTDNTATAAYDKANAAFDKANTGGSGGSSSGYLANSVIISNTTGYLTNTSSIQFFTSNNNLVLTGNIIAGGVRSTTSSNPPSSPTVGDIWYDTTIDVIYRYTYDGAGSYWIDITSATVSSNASSGGTSSSIGITSISIANSAYTILDDTAVSNTGGYIQLTGSNFTNTCSVIVGSNNVISTTFVNTSILRAQVGAAAPGTYHVYVADSLTGSSAIKPNGLTYSLFPVWGTGTSLLTATANISFSRVLSANSDSNIVYSNTSVLPTGSALLANGYFYGNISVGSDTTYNFDVKATDVELQDTSRTFSLPVTIVYEATYLLVAGGGAGGGRHAGGGGAGGILSGTSILTPAQTYTVTIGAGGAATTEFIGNNGSNSVLFANTAIGGGGGGVYPGAGSNPIGNTGGSGGGSGSNNGSSSGAAGTNGQGYAGGGSVYDSTNDTRPSGGGGGAGAVGTTGTSSVQANGGIGIISSITGTSLYFGGGGGGSLWCDTGTTNVPAGNGGLGGGGGGGFQNRAGSIMPASTGGGSALNTGGNGGTGSYATNVNGGNGGANTGGGGGGCPQYYGPYGQYGISGSGGSGIVIIRIIQPASATTGSPTVTTDAGYNIYTFTSSGSITF